MTAPAKKTRPARSPRVAPDRPPLADHPATPVDLAEESVAGEEDPGASLDQTDLSGNIGRDGHHHTPG